MRLNWNEIRVRAAQFSKDWADASYEKGETQSFYNELFEVFGVKRRKVAVFEQQVKKLNDKQGFIDLDLCVSNSSPPSSVCLLTDCFCFVTRIFEFSLVTKCDRV